MAAAVITSKRKTTVAPARTPSILIRDTGPKDRITLSPGEKILCTTKRKNIKNIKGLR